AREPQRDTRFVLCGQCRRPTGGLASAGSGNQVIMSTHTDSLAAAAADAVTAPLYLLLTDAALGAIRPMNPGGPGLRLAGALAVRPSLVASQGRQLLGEMARIAVGSSEMQPSGRDRRFTDPAWQGN